MQLTAEQVARFETDGFVTVERCLSPRETGVLKRHAADFHAQDREERWLESSGTTRTFWAMHTYDEAFRRLAAHPRLIAPARQLLGGPVYLHQFKLNTKAAFDGETWDWHQDFAAWGPIDGMPEPRALNVGVFLDDVTAANGPLLFMPGSHRIGSVDAPHRKVAADAALWARDRDTLKTVAAHCGCAAVTGAAGTAVIFSSLILHASPPNITPFDRAITYLSLAHVDNRARKFERPEWTAHRDPPPVEVLADDCIFELDKEDAPEPAVQALAASRLRESS